MSLSMYHASIPPCLRGMESLAAILAKAEKYAEEKKIDPAVLIGARLYPDMLPLSRQVQIASDVIKGGAARLAGVEPPSFPDTESTFAELQERIAKTVAFLNTIAPEQIDGSEERAISLKVAGKPLNFSGQDYLFQFVLPNLYFHITVAYSLLRHNGLEIGKADYLGKIQ